VVLMRDDLEGIPFSIWLARKARRVVRQSLGLAFGVIGVAVTLRTVTIIDTRAAGENDGILVNRIGRART